MRPPPEKLGAGAAWNHARCCHHLGMAFLVCLGQPGVDGRRVSTLDHSHRRVRLVVSLSHIILTRPLIQGLQNDKEKKIFLERLI